MNELYSFSFQYKDGSSYSGSVLDDGFFGYKVGEQIATSYGYYSINADLGAGAGPIGGIKISQYHDAFNGQNYTPQLYADGEYSGYDLGNEYDNITDPGVASTFGGGGLNELRPGGGGPGPLSPYSFTFTYYDGSSYSGTVYDNGERGYYVGEQLYTASGVYKLSLLTSGPTLKFPLESNVTIGSYHDNSSGKTYTLPPGDAIIPLGQELNSIPGASGTLLFGEGGKYEATQKPTKLFNFTFTSTAGFIYEGTVADDGLFGYQVGQKIAAPGGIYAITGIQSSSATQQQSVGSVQVTTYYQNIDLYNEANGGSDGGTHPLYTSQGLVDGAAGIGSERDFVDVTTTDPNLQTARIPFGGAGLASAGDPPVAIADSYIATENTTLTVPAAAGLLANDATAGSSALTAALVTGPAHGALTLLADGSFTYAPNASYFGADSFTYRASAGTLQSDPTVVSLTINRPARPPVARDDRFVVQLGSDGIFGSVLDNDLNPTDFPLTTVLQTGVAHGTLDLFANGQFDYTPDTGFAGVDTFTYVDTAGTLTSNVATDTIFVIGDQAPVAAADSYMIMKGATLTVPAAAGLLANDTDAEGDALTAALVTGPAHGALTLGADGGFTYTPVASYTGVDSFNYQASDGTKQSATTTVSLTIKAQEQAPVAVDDSFSTLHGIGVDGSVLANDTGPAGDTLTVTAKTGVAHGSLDLKADGSFEYTPDSNFIGADSFTYVANDGALTSNVATVTFKVTDLAPVAVDDSFTVPYGAAANGFDGSVLANDTDPDGDMLIPVVKTDVQHGTLDLGTDGSFKYTPVKGFLGTDTFSYFDGDGALSSNVAMVTFNVVDRAPVAVDDSYTLAHVKNGVSDIAGSVLTNDTDPDGDTLTAKLKTSVSHGTLTYFSTTGDFEYTPNPGFGGTDSFTYVANDRYLDSNIATVTFHVTADRAPVAVDDSYTLAHVKNGVSDITGSVLTNDTDPDGDALTASLKTGVAHGTLSLASQGNFEYTPDPGFSGTDSFTYVANDRYLNSNIATVTFNVTGNPAPVAADASFAVVHDRTVVENLPVAGSDTDGNNVTTALNSDVKHGTLIFTAAGSFTYTPDAGYLGTDKFTYTESDGALTSNVATVTLNVTDQAPVAMNSHDDIPHGTKLTVELPVFVSDADGDALTISIKTTVAHGALAVQPNGAYLYTPDTKFVGNDSFTYVASDGLLTSNVGTITINVGDEAPVAADASFAVVHDRTVVESLPVAGSDTDDNNVTAALNSDVKHGTLIFTTAGSFTYTPNAGYLGTDKFTYTESDGALTSNVATVTLNVKDQAPVAMNSHDDIPHGTKLTVELPVFVSDADGDALKISIKTTVAHGALAVQPNGAYLYTPDTKFVGNDSFTYVASDGLLTSNVGTITINVGDEAPVAADASFAVVQDRTVVENLPVAGSDTDDNNVTTALNSDVKHGTLIFTAAGSFTYTPDAGYLGTDKFTYTESDGALTSNVATVTLTVGDPAPVAVNDSFSVLPGAATFAGSVLTNDTYADFNTVESDVKSNVTHGTLNYFDLDGGFLYTPTPGFSGTDSFTYVDKDPSGTSNVATVTFKVSGNVIVVKPPPVAVNDSFSVLPGAATFAGSVLTNDTYADFNTVETDVKSNVAHGTLNYFDLDGGFLYTPTPGFSGTDSFTYVDKDPSGTSNVATVTFTVAGIAPILALTAPAGKTLTAGTATGISGVTLTENPAATGETFTVKLADTNGLLYATGTGVTGSGSKALTITGSLTTVNAGLATLKDTELKAGADSIMLSAGDSAGNASPVSSIAVTVNGTPFLAAPGSAAIVAGGAAALKGVVLSETGITTGEIFTVKLTDRWSQLAATGSGVSGAGSTALTISGSLAEVNADLATLTDNSGDGTDKIVLGATDSLGGVAGAATITVTASYPVSTSQVSIAAGQIVTNQTLGEGASQIPMAGARTYNIVVKPSAVQVVLHGATTTDTILEGGVEGVLGVANRSQINKGSYQIVQPGGISVGANIDGGGYMYVLAGGTATNSNIFGGGTMLVGAGGKTSGFITFSHGGNAVLSVGGTTLPDTVLNGFIQNNASVDAVILTGFTYAAGADTATLGAGNILTLNLDGRIEKLDFNPAESNAGHSFSVTTNSLDQVVIIDPVTGAKPNMNFLAPATAAGSPNVLAQIMGRSADLIQDVYTNGVTTAAFQPALKNFAAIDTLATMAGASLAPLNLPAGIVSVINKLAAHPA